MIEDRFYENFCSECNMQIPVDQYMCIRCLENNFVRVDGKWRECSKERNIIKKEIDRIEKNRRLKRLKMI